MQKKGGDYGDHDIAWFNGGLFKHIDVPPLTTADAAPTSVEAWVCKIKVRYNGTTHAAITHLQGKGWAETFMEAVHKARVRRDPSPASARSWHVSMEMPRLLK